MADTQAADDRTPKEQLADALTGLARQSGVVIRSGQDAIVVPGGIPERDKSGEQSPSG